MRMPDWQTRLFRRSTPGKRRSVTLVIPALLVLAISGSTVGCARAIRGSEASLDSAVPAVANAAPAAVVAEAAAPATVNAVVAVTAQDGVIRLPVTDFGDGTARFYTYQSGDKALRFFVLESTDGEIRAAFDACDVCFASKQGYHQEGEEMVCNTCGTRFPSNQINVLSGGCNPAPLARQVQGEEIIIQAADIEDGATFF